MQEAENQTIAAVGQKLLCVLYGNGKLGFRITKASFSGTDHRHNLHPGFALGNQERPDCRCETAVKEVTVEFNTISTGFFCLDDIICTSAANFHKDFLHIS